MKTTLAILLSFCSILHAQKNKSVDAFVGKTGALVELKTCVQTIGQQVQAKWSPESQNYEHAQELYVLAYSRLSSIQKRLQTNQKLKSKPNMEQIITDLDSAVVAEKKFIEFYKANRSTFNFNQTDPIQTELAIQLALAGVKMIDKLREDAAKKRSLKLKILIEEIDNIMLTPWDKLVQ